MTYSKEEVFLGGRHGWVSEAEAEKIRANEDFGGGNHPEFDIDAAFAEVESDIDAESLASTASKPLEGAINDPNTTPAPQITNHSDQSTKQLIQQHTERFSDAFEYSPDDRAFNKAIAMELTKRDIAPFSRNYKKYDPIACKTDAISHYMKDLQTFDLYWIWSQHHSHEVSLTAMDGIFTGIFSGTEFDFDRAFKIAALSLTTEKKVEYLRLPESIQMQLASIRIDVVRQRQNASSKKEYERKAKLDAIEARAMDIRYRLQKYVDETPRARLNVDVHVNVWRALEASKESKTYLVDAMSNYKKITGESMTKSLLRRKKDALNNALKNCSCTVTVYSRYSLYTYHISIFLRFSDH